MSLESFPKYMCMDLFVVSAEEILLPQVVLSFGKSFQWQFFFCWKEQLCALDNPISPYKEIPRETLCYGHQRGGKAAVKLPGFPPSPWTPSRLHTHQEEWPGLHSLLTTNSIAAAKAQVLTSLLTSIAAFTNTTHVHQVRSSLEQGLQISKEK